ncbi:hypothetical protein D3C76_573820 [compost metagenome]
MGNRGKVFLRTPSNLVPYADVNSFRKADELLAKEWNVSWKEVKNWRIKNKYTWHEMNDRVSMELIPTIINAKFGHLGGVSEVSKLEKKLLEGVN